MIPICTAVSPTDRTKSVRNRCVIEGFGSLFHVVLLLFYFFCRCRGFCYVKSLPFSLIHIEHLYLFTWGPVQVKYAS